MQIKTISVTYGRKFNLGNYESLEISQTIWADLAEDEDETAAMAECWRIAKANVKEQAMPVIQATKHMAQTVQKLAGVTVEDNEGEF